jgi:hypothetical protein
MGRFAMMRSSEQIQDAAVRRFLQTALVVDDQVMTTEIPAEEKTPSQQNAAKDAAGSHPPAEPGTASGNLSGDERSDSAAETVSATGEGAETDGGTVTDVSGRSPGDVDVKRLADRFADAGIACGILKPTGEEEAVTRIVGAAARADIVVIDWWINDETGDNALEAIERTVREEEDRARRLIAVYTTQRQLGRIADRIRQRLGVEEHDDPHDEPDEELRITVGGTRIVILNKGWVTPAAEYADNHVPLDDLPNRMIAEFRQHVEGLVPSVALNALAAARENTHRVLQRLSRELDLGYAGHLLRIEHVDEGAGQLIDALADELRAVIEDDEETRTAAGHEGIAAWLDAPERAFSTSREIIDGLLAVNTADPDALNKLKAKHKSLNAIGEDQYTALLARASEQELAQRSDADFAMLLSLRHGWRRLPMLQLGTVLVEEPSRRYWLCVQPVCDSIRLEGPTRFPMLRLERWEAYARKQQFHIVVPGPASTDPPLRLWAASKPQDLHIIEVCPTVSATARFQGDEKGALRLPATNGASLLWLGQLKPAHAQRVAENLGRWMTRVGLDESEWLRRRGRDKEVPAERVTAPRDGSSRDVEDQTVDADDRQRGEPSETQPSEPT